MRDFTTVSVTCPPDQPSYSSDVSVGDWLVTPVLALPDSGKLSGTSDYPTPDNTYTWEFAK